MKIRFLADGAVVIDGVLHRGRIAKMIRLIAENMEEINSGRVSAVELMWNQDRVQGDLVYRNDSGERERIHCPECDTTCCGAGEYVFRGQVCADCQPVERGN